jgi:hypothetical protein
MKTKKYLMGVAVMFAVVLCATALTGCFGGGKNFKLDAGTYRAIQTDFATGTSGTKYNLVIEFELKADNSVVAFAYFENDGEQFSSITTANFILLSGTPIERFYEITSSGQVRTLTATDFSANSWNPTYTHQGESNKTDTLYIWGEDKGNAPMTSFVITGNNTFTFANGKSSITPSSPVFTNV